MSTWPAAVRVSLASVFCALALALGVASVASAGEFLYVANTNEPSVTRFIVGPGGSLSEPVSIKVPQIGFLAASPDGHHLFVGAGHELSSYTIASDGTLSLVGNTTASGVLHYQPAVSPNGLDLYWGDEKAAAINAFSIGSGGSLGELPSLPGAASSFQLAVSPGGEYLYEAASVPPYKTGVVAADSLVSGTSLSSTNLPNEKPRGLVVAPDGKHVYVAAEDPHDGNGGTAGTVSTFSVGPTGALTEEEEPIGDEGEPTGMVISPDGSHVYVIGDHGISTFSVGSEGKLTFDGIGEGSTGPALAMSASGKTIYATNYSNASVSVFSVGKTGVPTQVGLPVPTEAGSGASPFAVIAVKAGAPELSIAGATVSEPSSATATAEFTVSLSSPAMGPVTVDYATHDGPGAGGAKAPTDYEPSSGALEFAPGETSKTIPVTVKASGARGTHLFTVALSEPAGAEISQAVGTGTIVGPSPLQVSVSVSPSKLDVEQNEAGAVPLQPTATVTVKDVGRVPIENVALPAKLTVGWHGPAPINALPVSQIAGPSAAELQLGTLQPGESKPLQYTLQVEGDGQFDIESLVTGSEVGATVKALGKATIEPTSQLLVMKNSLGAVVHSQENPSLVKAGTHFLIKVVLENRSYLHRLQLDPYEAELSGNAHGGSLVKEGEPTTYEAPTGSLEEVKAPPVIVLAPRESRSFNVVVGTSGSNAFAQKGVGGGTRATIKFDDPEVSTLNAADEPTAAPDDRIVLTPGSEEFQVGIDDSATPQPPIEAWKPTYYIAKGVVLGWWDLTWGALKGLPDLGVLAFQAAKKNNPAALVTSLAKGTIDEMYYLTELWAATSADPAAREALVQSIQGKVEKAFADALWLLPEKGAALYDTINNAVGTYFTGIANNWSAGNWEQALSDMSESGTVAAGTIGPEVYRIAAGVLTRLAPAAEAWKAKVASDTTRTTEELEALTKAIEPAADAIKGIEEAEPGYTFSVPQLRKFVGMSPEEIAWLSDFVSKRKLSVVLRSRAEESIEWLKKGAFLKPSLIKSKNVSWLDANFLGYSPKDVGRVVLKKLKPLREIRSQLLERGIAEGSPEYEEVVARWTERKSTYAHELEEMEKWNQAKQAKGKWPWKDSSVDPTLREDEPKNYGFRLTKDPHDPEALVPEFEDGHWGSITGDIDLVSVSHPDGTSLSASEYVKVLRELADGPLGIQHPDSTVWVLNKEFWFPKKAAYLESKGNVEFGPDGEARKVIFNEAASDPTTWKPFDFRIVWERGFAVGPGQVP